MKAAEFVKAITFLTVKIILTSVIALTLTVLDVENFRSTFE